MVLSQFRVVMTIPPISWAEGSAPIEVKRANQAMAFPLRANGMPEGPICRPPKVRSIMNEEAFFERSHFRAIASSGLLSQPRAS
jgi:hypothetical protein